MCLKLERYLNCKSSVKKDNIVNIVFTSMSKLKNSIILTQHQALGNPNGGAAAGLAVAEKYVGAFGELAKASTTLLLPANTGDVGAMVGQVSGCSEGGVMLCLSRPWRCTARWPPSSRPGRWPPCPRSRPRPSLARRRRHTRARSTSTWTRTAGHC